VNAIKPILAGHYNTDKSQHPPHLEYYAAAFSSICDKEVRLLELGVYQGGSLMMWRDYFPYGQIAGVDINPISIDDPTGRIHFYQGSQEDIALLERIALEIAPQGFDIIIDDCAHLAAPARTSFWYLFDRHLKPGGIYAIEDWGTGYWDQWPDGRHYEVEAAQSEPQSASGLPGWKDWLAKRLGIALPAAERDVRRFPSHDYGMVGFIKQLVDELAYDDITCPGWGLEPERASRFQKMHLSHALALIYKKPVV
jgi:SAM-dependent methyltransferase